MSFLIELDMLLTSFLIAYAMCKYINLVMDVMFSCSLYYNLIL